ncbi:secreted RxLR effector protein 161-like [Photinus pyralis]|uniref:secreted RxLR effector protein 161-like n=1 Tax=Photinus pyralis TaxID=7054 RepID=UPI0012671AF7|nr:secreted RxLR effector protein 161-like [Photinus pyralis]
MNECKGSDVPIDPKLKLLTNENDKMTSKPFRQLIGCLMYVMIGTRPDISFALNMFSRYQDRATDDMWMYLKRILRYLKKTCNVGLEYKRDKSFDLSCYVDSDWGNDVEDRKSVTGFLFKLYNNTICWATRKQNCVTLSTTEAELVALCDSVKEGIWLRKLILDFGLDGKRVTYYEDNQGCIALVRNPENNRRVKHLDLKFKFICEHLERKHIVITYIDTLRQQADILTKGLQCGSFNKFKICIGLRDFSEGGC